MYIFHHIGGKEVHSDNTFSISFDQNFSVTLPSFEDFHLDQIIEILPKVEIPSLEKRRELVQKLAWFDPSDELLKNISLSTGMPQTLVQDKINSGKKISLNLSGLDLPLSNKTAFSGISPNDPREYFYFLSHFIMTGTPCVIKASSREPFFGLELIRYLHDEGLPKGMINLVYANSSHAEQSQRVKDILLKVDIKIVMGDAILSKDQVSFFAEHSRGLILDAEFALPHIEHSILWPNSCLAEHNFVIVGKENFNIVVSHLKKLYQDLSSGNLLEEGTTLGKIDPALLDKVTDLIHITEVFETGKILYPENQLDSLLSIQEVANGVIIEHFSEDQSCGMNPLFTSPLPLYLTCVRLVESFKDAFESLQLAQNEIKQKTTHDKCMALGVYGKNITLEQKELLSTLAYDVHYNNSPMLVEGFSHQGIQLHEVLTQ